MKPTILYKYKLILNDKEKARLVVIIKWLIKFKFIKLALIN